LLVLMVKIAVVGPFTQPAVQVTVMVAVPLGAPPAVAVKLNGAMGWLTAAATEVLALPVVSPEIVHDKLTVGPQAPVLTTLTVKLVVPLGATFAEDGVPA
jgi:hypothetical protein